MGSNKQQIWTGYDLDLGLGWTLPWQGVFRSIGKSLKGFQISDVRVETVQIGLTPPSPQLYHHPLQAYHNENKSISCHTTAPGIPLTTLNQISLL